MICPACGRNQDRVLETDESYAGDEVVRARRCHCGHLWVTRELHATKLPGRIPRTARKIDRTRRPKEPPHI